MIQTTTEIWLSEPQLHKQQIDKAGNKMKDAGYWQREDTQGLHQDQNIIP